MMGVSTNAILFYGYTWNDECDLLGEDCGDMEWQDVVAKKRGVPDPWSAFYEQRTIETSKWVAEHRAELDALCAVKKSIKEEFGCDIWSHCSNDFSIPYVSINAARKVAYRGFPQEIFATDLTVNPSWGAQLDRFMAELGIEKPHDKPGWFLVSYWG